MLPTIAEFSPYLVYIAPPLVGAFIGYLTNRIAIRMLFRPLKKWTIGPVRIPMTPGVIPSKRHEFSDNIGTMVGDHLLTGEELNKALLSDSFQRHLFEMIHQRLKRLSQLDLGSISNIIPDTYRNYLDIGLKTGIYRLKAMIHRSIGSDTGSQTIQRLADQWLDNLLEKELSSLISQQRSDQIFDRLENAISGELRKEGTAKALTPIISAALSELLHTDKRPCDILPQQIQAAIIDTARDQAPFLLEKAGDILNDPYVREKIISAMKIGVEEMVDGMGPMSTMVKGFLDMDMVDKTIRAYLSEKENDIQDFLSDEEMLYRVRAGIGERIDTVLKKQLKELFNTTDTSQVHELAGQVAEGLAAILRGPQVSDRIGAAVRDAVEQGMRSGDTTVSGLLNRYGGDGATDALRAAVKRELVSMSQSQSFTALVDNGVETLCHFLVNRPIGKLSYLVPGSVIEGVARSLTWKTTQTMSEEMGVIISSLDIKHIITRRIDSFDLLRLEQLLLSIMQEQFKYINLFGALLGFLIGCINLLFIIGTA